MDSKTLIDSSVDFYPFILSLIDFSDGFRSCLQNSCPFQRVKRKALFQVEMMSEENYGTIFNRSFDFIL